MTARHRKRWALQIGMLAMGALAACDGDRSGWRLHGQSTGAATAPLPDIGILSRIPVGPLAGIAVDSARLRIRNPYQGEGAAIKEGQYLYIHMNCAYCHGFDGGGGMGPNLADSYWRFGGDDADVFKSIYEGRGKGMPAWGAAINEDNIWKIVAYLRTLGGTSPQRGTQASGTEGQSGTGQRNAGAQTPEQQREPLKSLNEAEP
jgi:cytochrome c oxidase cbb3-type subunit III